MNFVILRKFLTIRDCNSLIACLNHLKEIPKLLGLLDGDDKTNTWYKSNRSKGLEYMYSTNLLSMTIANWIKKELMSITDIDFNEGINELCLPFCRYSSGGEIKAHRDIDKVGGLNTPVEYVVVCNLTQPGVDYIDKVDRLFINFNPEEVSLDGKKVLEYPYAETNNRIYPNLQKGDVIIFRNDISIHGVDPIDVLEGQQGRITCGFRSK